VEAYATDLYGPVFARLGWTAAKEDDDQKRSLRGSVLSVLAVTGRDPVLRAEAKRRARKYIGFGKDNAIHPEAVDPNLAGTSLEVLGEDADRPTWDAMRSLLSRSVEEVVRARLLWALSVAKDPGLATMARELVLDKNVRESEMMRPLWAQLRNPTTREAAWVWLKGHFDEILARVPNREGGWLVYTGRSFCDDAHAEEVQAFFGPKVQSLEGGPRNLDTTIEDIRLCAARKKAHEPSARELFGKKP
jgi:alanyl aminopeptidase